METTRQAAGSQTPISDDQFFNIEEEFYLKNLNYELSRLTHKYNCPIIKSKSKLISDILPIINSTPKSYWDGSYLERELGISNSRFRNPLTDLLIRLIVELIGFLISDKIVEDSRKIIVIYFYICERSFEIKK